MSTALSCSGCGAAGAEVEHGNPGPGELCAGPGMASQHGSLYCADCLACIPRPPETEESVRMTVRDLCQLLALAEGGRIPRADMDRLADVLRESVSPEEYEREFPAEPDRRPGGIHA